MLEDFTEKNCAAQIQEIVDFEEKLAGDEELI